MTDHREVIISQDNMSQQTISRSFENENYKFLYSLNGWTKRLFSYFCRALPGVMNPRDKFVKRWNKFFFFTCLVAIFVDPLFFFPLAASKEKKCMISIENVTRLVFVLRTMTDFVCLVHILIQFRLAYMVDVGDFIEDPKKIALHYIQGYFFVDLFIAFPLPQIMILLVLPQFKESNTANYAKNTLRTSVLIQYIPRLYRILPLLGGQSSRGFIFESASANLVVNLVTFVLCSHVTGSCWYLFGLQRLNSCLRIACVRLMNCEFVYSCGYGDKTPLFMNDTAWQNWKSNADAIDCFSDHSQFDFGIYQKVASLATEEYNLVTRYVYSLFWGFQQISTLAGNQTPTFAPWEVLFVIYIIGSGLLLFALLIGNMQNFFQALGQRSLKMLLRRRDVDHRMNHRRLRGELRRYVSPYQRGSAVTRVQVAWRYKKKRRADTSQAISPPFRILTLQN